MGDSNAANIWKNRIVGYGQIDVEDALAHENNWRIHSMAQQEEMRGILETIGVIQNIIINKRTSDAWPVGDRGVETMLDGHMRIALAMRHGQQTLPVTYVDLDPGEEAIALATFDPIGALAGSSREQLDAVLREIETDNTDVQKLLGEVAERAGLYAAEVGAGSAQQEAPEPQVDRAEELNKVWQVRPGDLWEAGRHRILCADCLNIENIRRVVQGDNINMIFADPPYGINIVAANGYVGGGEAYDIPFGGVKSRGLGTVGGSKPFGSKKVRGTDGASHVVEAGKYAPVIGDETTDTAIQSSSMLLAEYPKAVHVWWGGNYYASSLPDSACWLVWDKETTGNFADCELAWTNQDKAARLFRHQWNGMLRASERGRRVHPTQKPAALAVWVYETLGKDGDVILDPFLGSGPTLAAAEKMNRSVRAIEMSEAYVAFCLQRLADLGLSPRRVEQEGST